MECRVGKGGGVGWGMGCGVGREYGCREVVWVWDGGGSQIK